MKAIFLQLAMLLVLYPICKKCQSFFFLLRFFNGVLKFLWRSENDDDVDDDDDDDDDDNLKHSYCSMSKFAAMHRQWCLKNVRKKQKKNN